jgi:excisionase family DNA binding protein
VPSDTPPRFLTVEQVATTLAVSERLVYKLVKSGQLQSVHVGSAVRVMESDLWAYVERNRTAPAPVGSDGAAAMPAPAPPTRPRPRRRSARPAGFVYFPPAPR